VLLFIGNARTFFSFLLFFRLSKGRSENFQKSLMPNVRRTHQ
jgi:hypothetical protein